MSVEAGDVDLPAFGPAPLPARPARPTAAGPVGWIERLLRDRDGFLDLLDARAPGPPVQALARACLAATVVGASLFGAVLGAFRGGAQVAYCAVKLPLVLLVTLAVCAAPFVAIARVSRCERSPAGIVALTLAACARFAMVLGCVAPALWLVEGAVRYHLVVLAVVGACALAGASAASLLFRGLGRGGGAGARAGVAFAVIFALVGGQTSWLLRPFVVRPRTERVPFVRPLEGDLFDSVAGTSRSARGRYDREAPLPPGSR